MAGFSHGMNTDTVRELAAQIDSTARELRSIDNAIERVMADLARQWEGSDYHRFRGWWRDQHRPKLHRLVDSIEGLARSARYNADDQDRVSGAGGQSRGTGRQFENHTSFSVRRSAGLVFRIGGEDGLSTYFGSDGNQIRYRSSGFIGVDTGDVLEAIGFVKAVKGGKGLPISGGLGLEAFQGTEFIWDQPAGSKEDSLRGVVGGITRRMTSASNFFNPFGGYEAGEVYQDIASGEYAQPAAVANFTGVEVRSAAEFEHGGSVFGSEREIRAERVVERWQDGRVVEVVSLSGSTSAEVGRQIEGPLGSSLGISATAGTEAIVRVEQTTNAAGEVVSLDYVLTTHAEIGGEAHLGVGGGGASEAATRGVLVERRLTFDMGDPAVRSAVEQGGTSHWATQSTYAHETYRVFSTASDSSNANAILFEAGADSGSMELLHSLSRSPTS